ncbi:MAG: DNA polymerase III, subunit gamma and tau [Deltaproteobacteria bacterium RBG_13_52_11]|nr:MAG: DNA polymerase III, subunit gamma and tau [Deltaproteobacteria bacterium RBG_13_52_11]
MGSYLVIARKWRPQVFEELAGQEHVTRTLQNAIAAERLAHAFLFAGPRGVGKTSAARILAKAANCLQGPTQTPCNQCESCKEIADGNSIDVLEIDGASNTGVDNVRELRENVRYLPSKSRYKIYIIDEVHMLSTSAFNALLKTLEEPPPHVLFIFATTEPHKIPLTILSRCQRFDFRRIPLTMIFERLREITVAEGVTIDGDALMLICREAEGSMRDAQSLLDQAISYGGVEVKREDILTLLGIADRKILFDLSAAIFRKDAKGCLSLVDELYKLGYDLGQFCKDFLNHVRNLLVVKLEGGESPVLHVPEHEVRDLMDQAGGISFEDLHRLFQILLRGEELMARTPFPKVVLEMTVVEMARLDSLLPVEEILSRVEHLEHTLSRGGLSAEGVPVGSGQEKTGGEERSKRMPEEDVNETSSEPGRGELGEEALRQWEEFLTFVRGENPILASFLIQGSPVRLDDACLEIGFAKGSFAFDRVSEHDTLQSVQEIARRHFKQEVQVKVTPTNFLKDAKTESKPSPPDGGTDLMRHLKKEALDNPVVQEAVEIFQGRVVEVKVKKGS